MLLPSLGCSTRMWDPALAELAWRDRLDVVLLDLPGHGDAAPGEPETVQDLASATLAALDASMGLGPVVVAGVSLGGAIAVECARLNGSIAGIASFASALHFGTARGWAQLEAAAQADQTAAFDPTGTTRGWFTNGFIASQPHAVARAMHDLARVDVGSYVACCRALSRYDARGRVAALETRGIAVGGAADVATPAAQMRMLAREAPGFRYHELPGAHLAVIENASEAAWYLDQLLDATIGEERGGAQR